MCLILPLKRPIRNRTFPVREKGYGELWDPSGWDWSPVWWVMSKGGAVKVPHASQEPVPSRGKIIVIKKKNKKKKGRNGSWWPSLSYKQNHCGSPHFCSCWSPLVGTQTLCQQAVMTSPRYETKPANFGWGVSLDGANASCRVILLLQLCRSVLNKKTPNPQHLLGTDLHLS